MKHLLIALGLLVSLGTTHAAAAADLKDPACVKQCGLDLSTCSQKAQASSRQCLKDSGVAQELIETLVVCVAAGSVPTVCIARAGISTLRIAEAAERCLDGLSSALETCLSANKACMAACPEK